MKKEIKNTLMLMVSAVVLILGFGFIEVSAQKASGTISPGNEQTESIAQINERRSNDASAVFAGGCFWCVEANFEKVKGVTSVVSGYTGGHLANPTYAQVCSHATGHLEAVKVSYDASQVSYNDLLEVFWRTVDPTDKGGQFVDRGETYSPAIFVANDRQRILAKKSIERLQNSGRFKKPIVTPVRDEVAFYDAEDYHQDYFKTHPADYHSYRNGSGRDQFIASTWGKDKLYQVVGPTTKKADLISVLPENKEFPEGK